METATINPIKDLKLLKNAEKLFYEGFNSADARAEYEKYGRSVQDFENKYLQLLDEFFTEPIVNKILKKIKIDQFEGYCLFFKVLGILGMDLAEAKNLADNMSNDIDSIEKNLKDYLKKVISNELTIYKDSINEKMKIYFEVFQFLDKENGFYHATRFSTEFLKIIIL